MNQSNNEFLTGSRNNDNASRIWPTSGDVPDQDAATDDTTVADTFAVASYLMFKIV